MGEIVAWGLGLRPWIASPDSAESARADSVFSIAIIPLGTLVMGTLVMGTLVMGASALPLGLRRLGGAAAH